MKSIRELDEYFVTVEISRKGRRILRSDSDGRAGNGVDHWRAIRIGEQTVADLIGESRGQCEVTIADESGNLRGIRSTEYPSMKDAIRNLCMTFGFPVPECCK